MPSPAGHSRTRCARLNARTPACHSLWAAGHPPPRPSTAQIAKSAGGKVGLGGAWGICMPQAPFRAQTHIHARTRARAHILPPFLREDSVTRAPPGVRFSDTPVTEGPPPRRRRRQRKAVKGLNLPPASPPCSAMASRETHPPFDLGWTFRTSEVLKTLVTFRNIFMT